MQKFRNAEITKLIDIVKVKKQKRIAYVCFAFEISIDLVISENRMRFSKITKSIEIWKVKNISNLLMFFHSWDFERFVYFCILHVRISAFPTFGSAEMQKCRNAEIAESIDIVKVKKHKQIASVFHLSYFAWF